MPNPIEVAMAASQAMEMLQESGGVGYSERGKVFIWDGDTTKAEMLLGFLLAVKVSDEPVDLNAVESITVKYTNDGSTKRLTASEWHTEQEETVQSIVLNEIEDYFVLSSEVAIDGQIGKGIYIIARNDVYVEKVTFHETIHPIDKKYLPGVCLPVVELTTVIPIEGGATLNEADTALMNEVSAGQSAISLKVLVDEGDGVTTKIFGIANGFSPPDIASVYMYYLTVGEYGVSVLQPNMDGQWAARAI